ncbi:MAG: sulfatase-like hydrolase/transferase [Prosthecobacter sp.]
MKCSFVRCVLFALSFATIALAAERPNVLFIAVDDLKPALGCYGDGHAKTPNLDRFASRALRFDRAYCNQAVCSPSRNALMTSLRPQTLGIYDLSTNFRSSRPEAVTLAQHFRSHGYHTTAVGKILHTGHGNHDDAESWSEKPLHPTAEHYALPENTTPANAGAKGEDQRGSPTESADVSDDTYADGLIATEAVKKLAAAKDAKTPFFLAVGFLKPHLPFVAPKKYWDRIDEAKLPLPSTDTLPEGAPSASVPSTDELRKYKGMPPAGAVLSEAQKRTLIHGYYAAMSYADACIGRVLDALESHGLMDNTIVVVWGDHGYHLGDHGVWGKHTNFELAARIPLMVAVPGKHGAVSSALVETVDIYPTLTALAGLPGPQGLDGRSFAALFDSPTTMHRDHVTHVFPRREILGRSVRDDRYRLVEWNKVGAAAEAAVFELYDYQSDPDERANLAAAQPDVVAKLKTLLAQQPAAKAQISKKASAAKKQPEAERAEQFHQRDKDKNGRLTYDEFLLRQRDVSDAPERFRKLDADKDGFLTEKEYVNKGRSAKL